MPIIRTITPCLWFDTQAEEAAEFYCAVFPQSRITSVTHYGPDMPMKEGTVLTAHFELMGQSFMALNGGSRVTFNDAVSLMVNCADQAEIDRYWDALTRDGGKPVQCSWLIDRYGLRWQIVPAALESMLAGDAARTNRVMKEVMTMVKLDVARLEKAAQG